MPAMGMSALPAAFHLAGWQIQFVDVDGNCQLDVGKLREMLTRNAKQPLAKAVATVNLFGIPSHLSELRQLCDEHELVLLEDNSQAIFAIESGNYTGTVGDLAVISFNVHKHINGGEGGLVLVNNTDRGDFAGGISHFINHGEAVDPRSVGLNLRMTELTAAMILPQLRTARDVVASRNAIANKLILGLDEARIYAGCALREGMQCSWYNLPILGRKPDYKAWLIQALRAEGVSFVDSYAPPFHTIPAFRHSLQVKACECPNADMWDANAFVAELLAVEPTDSQISQVIEAFEKVYSHAD